MNNEQVTMVSMAKDGLVKIPVSNEELSELLIKFEALGKKVRKIPENSEQKLSNSIFNIIKTKSALSNDRLVYISSIKDALSKRKLYAMWSRLKKSENVDAFNYLIDLLSSENLITVVGNKIMLTNKSGE